MQESMKSNTKDSTVAHVSEYVDERCEYIYRTVGEYAYR